jgi:hypothetical protein
MLEINTVLGFWEDDGVLGSVPINVVIELFNLLRLFSFISSNCFKDVIACMEFLRNLLWLDGQGLLLNW